MVRREHHFRLTAVAGRRNDRLNEIIFNASVVLEANAIEAINSLLVELGGLGVAYTGRYKPVRLHAIRNDKLMEQLGFASKNSTLPGLSVRAAWRWLPDGGDLLGEASNKVGKRLSANVKVELTGVVPNAPVR